MNRLVLFEDEHLLAVNKPTGINTHRPDPYAIDGIHEWLARSDPARTGLSILHRLDKDTSGVLVFGKTREANRSLSHQFETQQVAKEYEFLTDHRPLSDRFRVDTRRERTAFEVVDHAGKLYRVLARPQTGKTHQIRRHAAREGVPVLGDQRYGGGRAPRLMLHACRLSFRHPLGGAPLEIQAPRPRAWGNDVSAIAVAIESRDLFLAEPDRAVRLVNGEADGLAGVTIDQFAGTLLVRWLVNPAVADRERLISELAEQCEGLAIWEQMATRHQTTSPQPVGESTARPVIINEHGLRYRVRLAESGLSAGLFIDQRENRRRLMQLRLTGQTVLNCFAYTCGFSVAAASAGGTVTSVDLSRRYLDWGRENFQLNGLGPDQHDFIYGDVFSWLRRFRNRRRQWDVVILDPPTFSSSRRGRVFRAAHDYQELVSQALPLTRPGGLMFCSTNCRSLDAAGFERLVRDAVTTGGRTTASVTFVTQPFDFRTAPAESPYLKTVWLQLGD